MIKKWFDWTPRDLAYWENLRRKGPIRFILVYGVAITGGLFFLILGLITFFNWLRQLSGATISLNRIIFLLAQLAFVALVALAAGMINSLITWLVEEKLYRKYKSSK
ncbi:MAG TPA: hypothetical protein VLD65_01275 [Anaerolineales bacterium]|nr:hypothetical protein [Anaerolineales bacterium]